MPTVIVRFKPSIYFHSKRSFANDGLAAVISANGNSRLSKYRFLRHKHVFLISATISAVAVFA